MDIKIIPDALSYYDKNVELYRSIMKNIHSTETINNITNFFDKKQNIVFSSKIQIIGTYNRTKKLWIWGWCMSNKINNYLIRKLLLYGIAIESTNIDILLLKTDLITSHINITDYTQIDIFCALAMYLSKITCIYISSENILDNEIKVMYFVLDPPKL